MIELKWDDGDQEATIRKDNIQAVCRGYKSTERQVMGRIETVTRELVIVTFTTGEPLVINADEEKEAIKIYKEITKGMK